jgi:hypothetical protein
MCYAGSDTIIQFNIAHIGIRKPIPHRLNEDTREVARKSEGGTTTPEALMRVFGDL